MPDKRHAAHAEASCAHAAGPCCCCCTHTCVAVAAKIPAPFAFRSFSTYVRSLAGVLRGPEDGMHAPVLASAVLLAGQTRHRCRSRPASVTVLITVPAAALLHWQVPPAVKLAGCHDESIENPFAKLVVLPLLGSHSTQLSLSADGTSPAACTTIQLTAVQSRNHRKYSSQQSVVNKECNCPAKGRRYLVTSLALKCADVKDVPCLLAG